MAVKRIGKMISLEPEMLAHLRAQAARTGATVSGIIRVAVREYLALQEDLRRQAPREPRS